MTFVPSSMYLLTYDLRLAVATCGVVLYLQDNMIGTYLHHLEVLAPESALLQEFISGQ
jgi:hypothetical protein